MTDRYRSHSVGDNIEHSAQYGELQVQHSEANEAGGYLKSRVLKRSIVVGRHKTSVSLEDVFWNELRSIAQNWGMHLSQLVAHIDAEREHCNLSSAIRLFVFEHRMRQADSGQPLIKIAGEKFESKTLSGVFGGT
jgi:predicted DNA-binding ribbon-helix-helix protein